MRREMNQKGLVILLAILLAISVTGNVYGSGTLTEIDAYLNSGIKIMLHGKTFEAMTRTPGPSMCPSPTRATWRARSTRTRSVGFRSRAR